MVVLLTADGQRLSIGLQVLSREDQDFVKAGQQSAMEKKDAPPALPDDLRGPEAKAAAEAKAAEAKAGDAKPEAAPAVPAVAPAQVTPPGRPQLPTLSRPGSKKSADVEVLTEEQIAALKRVLEEKDGEKIEFNGGTTPKNHLGKDEKEWKPDQPIPFKITCELVRVRPKKSGGEDRKNLSSNVRFYMMDEAGAVLFNKSLPIDRMLPAGDSGYKDEVAKPGKYTVVMFADYKGTMFGLKEKVSITIPKAR